MCDHIGAKILCPILPDGTVTMIADKGADKSYDSDEYRAALVAKDIKPRIPPRKRRKAPASFSETQYKQHHKIENMFGRLKGWRRITTRYDRRSDICMAAIALAAIITW